jgi:pyocin large subunit-like protein
MSTKGASNHYGNARGGVQGHQTAHTGFAWAKDFNRSTVSNHFDEHGKQMNTDSEKSYVSHAVKFANTVDRVNNESFIDKKGSTHKFNKKTGEYAIITKDGYVVTYYKPTDGYEYFKNQYNKKGKNKK